jgi:hypothetical protein
MQDDGNLVMYDVYNNVVWESNTYLAGPIGHSLIMQSDGNLVIYDGSLIARCETGTKATGTN